MQYLCFWLNLQNLDLGFCGRGRRTRRAGWEVLQLFDSWLGHSQLLMVSALALSVSLQFSFSLIYAFFILYSNLVSDVLVCQLNSSVQLLAWQLILQYRFFFRAMNSIRKRKVSFLAGFDRWAPHSSNWMIYLNFFCCKEMCFPFLGQLWKHFFWKKVLNWLSTMWIKCSEEGFSGKWKLFEYKRGRKIMTRDI